MKPVYLVGIKIPKLERFRMYVKLPRKPLIDYLKEYLQEGSDRTKLLFYQDHVLVCTIPITGAFEIKAPCGFERIEFFATQQLLDCLQVYSSEFTDFGFSNQLGTIVNIDNNIYIQPLMRGI